MANNKLGQQILGWIGSFCLVGLVGIWLYNHRQKCGDFKGKIGARNHLMGLIRHNKKHLDNPKDHQGVALIELGNIILALLLQESLVGTRCRNTINARRQSLDINLVVGHDGCPEQNLP